MSRFRTFGLRNNVTLKRSERILCGLYASPRYNYYSLGVAIHSKMFEGLGQTEQESEVHSDGGKTLLG